MKRLSIIIVTYNSEKDIYDCIASIRKQCDIVLSDLELIIVDNCSLNPDAMFAQIKAMWGDDVLCIKNNSNGGYGQGNNVGIQASTAPVALIMNPDVRLVQPIFARALQRFDKNSSLGVLGMSQYYPSGRKSRNSVGVTWLVNGYLRTFLQALANRIGWYWPKSMYAQGSCFFVRKEPFVSVGMFDETNFMYGEEEDLHYRLKQKFGLSCFAFDRSLSYQHLAERRTPSFEYEQHIVDANVRLYQKKGFDKHIILKHFRQNAILQLWKERLISPHGEYKQILQRLILYINNQFSS